MQATLLTLAIAAILALLAALLGPHFVDWNAHRATFEEQASQAIGLPVRVTGNMDVRLLPSPSLVLSGVEIGRPGDAQALRAKALGIEFALPPLLSGKLKAVELRLIAPEMRVSLTADGRAMLPNALAGIDTQALSIDKLTVEDASLQLADAASGTSATLSKLWFNGEVRALPGPIRGEGAFVMDGALYGYRISTGRPEANGSRIKLTVDPADRPVFAEAEGFVTTADGAPQFEGTATVARRVPPKGDKGDVAEPWRITSRVKANAVSALFEQVEYQYGPDERALKLNGTAEAKFGAHPRLDAVLTARTLDADKLLGGGDGAKAPRAALAALVSAAERIIGPPIPTQLGFGVDALTLGGASIQNIRGDIEFGRGQMVLSAFEARAPGFTQVQASGRIEKAGDHLSFAGPVAVTSTDPRAFADWLEGKAGASGLPARPVRFRGEVTLGADKVAVEGMQADFDRKSFDGDLVYVFAHGSDPSQLTASLRAEELDLDAWMETAEAVKVLPDIKQPHDVSLALALKRVRFGGLDADAANVQLSMKAGALAIETLTIGNLAGLGIDGKGRFDTQAQRGSVSFNIAVRDADGLATLAKRAPPVLSDALQRAVRSAVPGKLTGTVNVEPAGSGNSRALISVSGPVGAVDLKMDAALTGRLSDLDKADVSVDAFLNAADVNSLLKLAAVERFVAAPRQPGTYTLVLKGKARGDMTIDTRIGSGSLDARATGSVRPFADDARRTALDITIGRADITLEGMAAKAIPVAIKTKFQSDALSVRFEDLAGSIAGSSVRGGIALASGDVPAIDGELRTDTIDIAALFGVATGLARSGKNERGWSETPFALPALPRLSGGLTLSAAQAVLSPSLQATKFRSALRFTDSGVRMDDIAGELLGGQLSAEVTLRRAPDALGLQGKVAIADADATQLLFGDGAAPLTGRAALTAQFEGMGRSPRALIGSLNGSGTIVLDQARIASLDPKVFDVAMQSVDQGLPIDAPRVREIANRGLGIGPLVVPHAEATLTIAAGVARIDTFKAQAEAADLAVTGSYDFSDARVDLRFAMSGPAPAGSLPPEISVQLRGLAAKPERNLDISAFTGWLALRSVDRHTKKIEAIEQGRQVEETLAPAAKEAAPEKPDAAVGPRRKPSQPAAQPLPPAVEIRPAPGDLRRVLPQPPQRAEPQRVEPQRPGGANPFPTPIGSPPAPSSPVARPTSPQTVRPIF